MSKQKKEYVSIPELAKLMGISRIAVFNKVKSGVIKAVRIGRNYAVKIGELGSVLGKDLDRKEKREIDAAVKKTVAEYGETLKLLGRE